MALSLRLFGGARSEKVLIGVAHANRVELTRLQHELNRRKPKSVGLELREDYDTAFTKVGFFGDLYTYLRTIGIPVVLLENPDLWNEYKSVELIKMMHEGSITIAQIESELAAVAHRLKGHLYLPPEVGMPLENAKRRFERALAINTERPTQEALMRFWSEIISRRSEYFVKIILDAIPDIVVVGLGHALQMEEKLHGRYKLEKFSGEMPTEIPRTTRGGNDLL